MAGPRHTYLLQPGRWSARGSYLDAAGTAVAASGESRVEHGADEWVAESWMRLELPERPVLATRQQIEPLGPGESTALWTAESGTLGTLLGRYVVVADAILSVWSSEDGRHTGSECLALQPDGSYRGHGCLLEESELVSAWALRLERAG